MAGSAVPDVDDAALVQGLRQGSGDAVRATYKKYGPRVKGYLRSQFGDDLREPELDEALNVAACNLWRSIGSYDPARCSLLGWFISIAHNAALDELRKERRQPAGELKVEPAFRPARASERADGAAETETECRVRLMWYVIHNELKGNMKAVAVADMESGGEADRKELASQLGIPIAQVDVTRSHVRKRLRERVLQLEQDPRFRAGKP